MNARVQPSDVLTGRRLPFECVALVLQGGGALGAYQAGVYAALAEADIRPDWVAGISIGAINAAKADQQSFDVCGVNAHGLLDWLGGRR
jgi:NTE family protein